MFFQRTIQKANKHMKKCSTSVVFGKCKSKLQDITSYLLKWLTSVAHQLCGHPFIIAATIDWREDPEKATNLIIWPAKSADSIII